MFIARTIFHPAAGCLSELRAVLDGQLEGHVAAQLAVRSTLTQRMWGSLPELRISRWYDSLADFEAVFRADQPNPPVAAQLKSLLAIAPGSDIDEVLAPAADGPDPAYLVRFEYHPAQGHVQALHQALEERVRAAQAAGRRANLTMRVSGGPALLSLHYLFQDLGALEQARAQTLQDPAAQEFSRSVGAHLARPADTPHIYRVVRRVG
jgi:hypothetical protein